MSKPSVKLLSLKSLKTSSFVLCLGAILFGSGCASTGSIQPHHAFRQSATPYQAYQGYQGYGNSGDYVGAGGYNNSLPGFGQQNFQPPGQANPTTGYYGSGGSGSTSFPPQGPVTNGYPQYAPPASYSYQPAYSGGFTGGSC